MKNFSLYLVTFVSFVFFLNTAVSGEAKDLRGDQKLCEDVLNKVLKITNVKGKKFDFKYPPKIEIVDDEVENAYAYAKDGVYRITINKGLMNKFGQLGEADKLGALTFVIGHELGHIFHGHVDQLFKRKRADILDDYIMLEFSRENEYEADIFGAKAALNLGISFKSIEKAMELILENEIETIQNVLALRTATTHPDYKKRIENVLRNNENRSKDINKDRKKLWSSLSTFELGAYFLSINDYATGILNFNKVIEDFPDCYEAYANIGYAKLMQYLEYFDENIIAEYKIPQIIVGAYYTEANSLKEKRDISGREEERRNRIWQEAVDNFILSLAKNPVQPLVKANLGLAYYLDPNNKSLKEAAKYFQEAIEGVEKDKSLNAVQVASIYLNASSYFYFDKDEKTSMILLQKAEQRGMRTTDNTALTGMYVRNAILLNKTYFSGATGKAQNDRKKVGFLENYLSNMPANSAWWKYAQKLYLEECKKLGLEPKEIKGDVDATNLIRSLTLKNGKRLFIGQPIEDAIKEMKNVLKVPINDKLIKYILTDFDMEIVGGSQIVMINIKDADYVDVSSIANKNAMKYIQIPKDSQSFLKNISKDGYKHKTIKETKDEKVIYFPFLGVGYKSVNNQIKEIILI